MKHGLDALRIHVQREIESYVYTVPDCAVGNPLPADRVQTLMDELKATLVEPYMTSVALRDTFDQCAVDRSISVQYAIVADDGINVVFYDDTADEFGLAQRGSSGGIETIGVRGDVVGVFMAR